MKSPTKIGQTRGGKTLYFLPLSRLSEWPAELRLRSKYIRSFIACDARRLRTSSVKKFSSTVVQQGIVDLTVWGPNSCRGFHVPFFDATRTPKDDYSDWIIAECSQDSLRKSIGYFMTYGRVSRKYRRSCKSLLFVSIGNPTWARSMQRNLKTLRRTIVEYQF